MQKSTNILPAVVNVFASLLLGKLYLYALTKKLLNAKKQPLNVMRLLNFGSPILFVRDTLNSFKEKYFQSFF